jgi:hypothetical protein
LLVIPSAISWGAVPYFRRCGAPEASCALRNIVEAAKPTIKTSADIRF